MERSDEPRPTDATTSGGKMSGPHQGQQLVTAGTPVEEATAAMVLVHGRGATARSIVKMGQEVHQDGLALLAPQAAGNTWYPNSFLAPVEDNEPGRSSGLQAISDAIETATDAGVPLESVVLLGFSQGACLASEYVARNPQRYGGLVALSGGLIGDSVDPTAYQGDIEETPVFIGCSDVDPHIPLERVEATTEAFERLDGEVDERIYAGMGHGVNDEEIEAVAELVVNVLDDA